MPDTQPKPTVMALLLVRELSSADDDGVKTVWELSVANGPDPEPADIRHSLTTDDLPSVLTFVQGFLTGEYPGGGAVAQS